MFSADDVVEVDSRICVLISSLLHLPLTDTIRQWCIRARSEVLWLRASPEAGEELAERRSFQKPAPGIRSACSAKNRSDARPAPGKREAGVAGYYMECPPEVPQVEAFSSRYRVRRTIFLATEHGEVLHLTLFCREI